MYMFAEDHIQIDLKDSNHCTLHEDVRSLEVTYFETENQTDLLFLYQLTELMNTHLYVVNEYEYKPEIPLLSLVGFFVEYNPEQKAFEIDHADYLNAILQIPE
jgi:hypothetical protein